MKEEKTNRKRVNLLLFLFLRNWTVKKKKITWTSTWSLVPNRNIFWISWVAVPYEEIFFFFFNWVYKSESFLKQWEPHCNSSAKPEVASSSSHSEFHCTNSKLTSKLEAYLKAGQCIIVVSQWLSWVHAKTCKDIIGKIHVTLFSHTDSGNFHGSIIYVT